MTRRITILFVIGDLDVGGAERHLAQVLPLLRQGGYQPIVYTLTHKGRLAPQLEASGIEVKAPPFALQIRRLPRVLRPLVSIPVTVATLWWFMRLRRPQIVHFFLPAAYLVGGLCSLIARVPLRVMSRRSLNHYQRGHPLLKKLEFWLHRHMTVILGNSRAVLVDLADEGIPLDRLGLIYSGIDIAQFENLPSRGATRAKLGLSETTLALTIVGNLIAYKGHSDLLTALANVCNDLPDEWALVCMGRDTGLGNALRTYASTLGIENHILWLGERHDVAEILHASDIGIVCSHQEGFSNAVLEAMAAGLPMIVTDVGGNPEAVVEGVTGCVVPPHDAGALGGAILKLVRQSTRSKAMGEAGRKRVVAEFLLSDCVDRYVKLYAALRAGARQPVAEILTAGRS